MYEEFFESMDECTSGHCELVREQHNGRYKHSNLPNPEAGECLRFHYKTKGYDLAYQCDNEDFVTILGDAGPMIPMMVQAAVEMGIRFRYEPSE